MIDWNRPIQTVDGRRARLIGSSGCVETPYRVAICKEYDEEFIDVEETGHVCLRGSTLSDIVNVPDVRIDKVERVRMAIKKSELDCHLWCDSAINQLAEEVIKAYEEDYSNDTDREN